MLAEIPVKNSKTCRSTGEVKSDAQLFQEWLAGMRNNSSQTQRQILEDLQLSDCPFLRTGLSVRKWIDDVEQFVRYFKEKNVGPLICIKFKGAVRRSKFGPVTEKIVHTHVKKSFVQFNDDSVEDAFIGL